MATKLEKELKNLVINDLKRSGLNDADYKKMKLNILFEDEAELILNHSFCTSGYLIPYFDVNGKEIEYVRVRFLEELKDKNGKIQKYSQTKNTPPRLYFPPCINWKEIVKDNSVTITFTEGEKKAYKACKEGIPTIGLGGVWSFRSKKLKKLLIDDFKLINLSNRNIEICYDNDSQTNPEVIRALYCFAKELHNNGSKVFNKMLPFNAYNKIGMDDYLLENTKNSYLKLANVEFEGNLELNILNSEIAYIREIGKIYIKSSKLFVSHITLTKVTYANRTVLGDEKLECVANQWLEWPKRKEYERLTYKPGQPEVTENNELNLWQGWGCTPKKGSVSVFINAVNKIFNKDKKLITWFLDWVAYPIQNPGTKMLSAVLLQSISQGTGKSSLGLCIGAMYGDNYSLINDSQLNTIFNSWAVNKQFILGDEISGKDKRAESDMIKNLITRPTIPIRKMRTDTYFIPDCIAYFLTSNHPDPLNIDPDDRRIFVHEIKYGCGLTLDEGKALEKFRNGKGTSYLLNYFINEHKLSAGFDHQARPPMTQSKENLINHSLTDIERFLAGLKNDIDYVLSIDGVSIDRDLYTTSQVLHLFERSAIRKNNVSLTAMGKAIKKIFPNCDERLISTLHGKKRLRSLRNIDKWNKLDNDEWQKHFNKSKIALFEVIKKSKLKGKVK